MPTPVLSRVKRLFDARGRSGRSRFWITIGLLLLPYIGAVLLLVAGRLFWPLYLLAIPLLIAIAIASLVNTIRRLHDFGLSGWWVLGLMLAGVPGQLLSNFSGTAILGGVVSIVLGLGQIIWLGGFRGQPHANRFGEPQVTVPGPEPILDAEAV